MIFPLNHQDLLCQYMLMPQRGASHLLKHLHSLQLNQTTDKLHRFQIPLPGFLRQHLIFFVFNTNHQCTNFSRLRLFTAIAPNMATVPHNAVQHVDGSKNHIFTPSLSLNSSLCFLQVDATVCRI